MTVDLPWLYRHRDVLHVTANAFRFVQARWGTLDSMLRMYEGRDC